MTPLEYQFSEGEVLAANQVGVGAEMVGQYLFDKRATGQLGPGEARLEGAERIEGFPAVYRLWGTHRA